jgi:hypothetical protein
MYQIRKCQTYSVTSKTKTANLDPEKFRNLSLPYEGNSEEDFVFYISGLYIDDIYQELDNETLDELNKFFDDVEWEEWYNSAWDEENSWYESGEENEEYTRTGGFEVRYSTENGY